MRKRGRPKTSKLPRAEQLRRAKRRQRARQRAAGTVHVQLTVPKVLAEKMAVARRADLLTQALDEALAQTVIRIHDYPQLSDLAWNRRDQFMLAREAFQLYERNWRFVDPNALVPEERRLIEHLKAQFGAGVMNA